MKGVKNILTESLEEFYF